MVFVIDQNCEDTTQNKSSVDKIEILYSNPKARQYTNILPDQELKEN